MIYAPNIVSMDESQIVDPKKDMLEVEIACKKAFEDKQQRYDEAIASLDEAIGKKNTEISAQNAQLTTLEAYFKQNLLELQHAFDADKNTIATVVGKLMQEKDDLNRKKTIKQQRKDAFAKAYASRNDRPSYVLITKPEESNAQQQAQNDCPYLKPWWVPLEVWDRTPEFLQQTLRATQ